MKLIVGLGNPGKEYENTRHNCGWKVISQLEDALNVTCNMVKFQGLYCKTKYQGEDVILLKPTTYMNNSGISIRECMQFFKIDASDVIVIYDDMDIPCGKVRLRNTGNPGGHNGMKSVIAHMNTKDFMRIRVGIGRDPQIRIIDYVLMNIPKDQQANMEAGFKQAKEAVLTTLQSGFNKAMNLYNIKGEK